MAAQVLKSSWLVPLGVAQVALTGQFGGGTGFESSLVRARVFEMPWLGPFGGGPGVEESLAGAFGSGTSCFDWAVWWGHRV